MSVYFGSLLWGWGRGWGGGWGGFSTIDQSLTERGLKGGQEKKERIKEKRFDACSYTVTQITP